MMTEHDAEQIALRGAEIQEGLARSLSERLNMRVYSIDPKSIDDAYKVIIKDAPELKRNFSEAELRREVSNFISGLIVVRPDNSALEDRIEQFINDLSEEKEYESIVLLKGLIGLPIGTTLGPLEIINRDDSKTELMEHVKYLESKGVLSSQDCSWARIVFKSYRTVNLSEVLYKLLELPYSILSLIMHLKMDVSDTVGIIYAPGKTRWFLGQPFPLDTGWSRYNEDVFGRFMKLLSDMSGKEKRTRLEDKIIQAVQVFWLSRQSTRPEIRFLLLVAALESLLLTENDRDYLGHKLAEKAAFLLEQEKDKRLNLSKRIKRYYGKRSNLVHKGQASIGESDVRAMDNIFIGLVFKLLELTRSYEKVEQKSHDRDKEGIEDYIDSLKFA